MLRWQRNNETEHHTIFNIYLRKIRNANTFSVSTVLTGKLSLCIFFHGKEKHVQDANSGSVLAAITVGSLFIIGCMMLLFIRRTCHPKRGEQKRVNTKAANWLYRNNPLFQCYLLLSLAGINTVTFKLFSLF